MNLLIFKPEERNGEIVTLIGDRAKYVYEFHDLKQGVEFKAGELGGKLARAVMLEVSSDKVMFSVKLQDGSVPKQFFALVSAIPRPQTVKKVLQYASMLGLSEVHLIRSENTVPSYLSSKALEPQNVEREVIKGLEQAMATDAPSIYIWKSFGQFAAESLPMLSKKVDHRLLADPSGNQLSSLNLNVQEKILLAIGPEKGWSKSEINQFADTGFETFSLGDRILRVEVALVAAWAKLQS